MMLPEIHQDVHESVPDHARRREITCVIAVGPDSPAPAERAVHGSGQADGETTNAAGEQATVLRLGDEVNVVVLDAEFDDAKLAVRRCRDRRAHGREDAG